MAGGPLLRHDHNAIRFESLNKLNGGAPLLALFEKWAFTLPTAMAFPSAPGREPTAAIRTHPAKLPQD
jgi:hypothetical protein